jgi:hypothetical protein
MIGLSIILARWNKRRNSYLKKFMCILRKIIRSAEMALFNIHSILLTADLKEIHTPEGFKSYVHDTFMTMIRELIAQQNQIATTYKNNPTIPFDYYSLLLREIDAKIQCKQEVYKRLTDEELDLKNL